jgi:hypothetical protein
MRLGRAVDLLSFYILLAFLYGAKTYLGSCIFPIVCWLVGGFFSATLSCLLLSMALRLEAHVLQRDLPSCMAPLDQAYILVIGPPVDEVSPQRIAGAPNPRTRVHQVFRLRFHALSIQHVGDPFPVAEPR